MQRYLDFKLSKLSIGVSVSREMQAGSGLQGRDRGCKYTVAHKVAQDWHHFEKIVGLIVQTMTILLVIKAAEMNVTKKMLPLLAGNLPRMIQYYEELEWTHYYSAKFVHETQARAFVSGPSTTSQRNH